MSDPPGTATVPPPDQAADVPPAKRGITGQAAGITQTGSVQEMKPKGRITDAADPAFSRGKGGYER